MTAYSRLSVVSNVNARPMHIIMSTVIINKMSDVYISRATLTNSMHKDATSNPGVAN